VKREALLGRYEFTTSALGFGTAGLFREPSKPARRRLLESAIAEGVLHFDTAPMYGLGLAQGELGEVFRGRRGEVVIVSKVGIGLTPLAKAIGRIQAPVRRILQKVPALQQQARQGAAGPSSGRLGGLLYQSTFDIPSATRSLDDSLRELGTEYLDLLLLHDPEPSQLNLSELYDFLEGARTSGKIRAWGVAGEAEATMTVVKLLPGPTPIVQIRDDVFRRDEYVSLPSGSDYLVTFGVLGESLPRVLAHVTANIERTREWSDATGEDCANPTTVAALLLKDALRANERGTVLYSTTRAARLRDAVALADGDASQPDAALSAFRRLVRAQLGPIERTPEGEL
jgi:D-threo-aldose 1-dehydrogenase